MSTILRPTITEAGLQAVFNADHDGFAARLTHVALGEGAYRPDQNRRDLHRERSRFPIASGQKVTPTQIHLSVIDDSAKAFWVREVGFFLEDGTLFAVYSEPGKALAYKSPDVDLLMAFDVVLTGVPADSINIIDQGADLNLLVAPELAKMAATHVDHLRRYLTLKDDLEHDALWRTMLQAQTATVQIDGMRRYLTDKLG